MGAVSPPQLILYTSVRPAYISHYHFVRALNLCWDNAVKGSIDPVLAIIVNLTANPSASFPGYFMAGLTVDTICTDQRYKQAMANQELRKYLGLPAGTYSPNITLPDNPYPGLENIDLQYIIYPTGPLSALS
jgi:hypothetical protein